MAKTPTKRNIRIQLIIAIYDILALLPLAIPLLIQQHLTTLSAINISLGGTSWPEYNVNTLIWMQLVRCHRHWLEYMANKEHFY